MPSRSAEQLRREAALNAPAASQTGAENGRDRERSTAGVKPATESGTPGPAATPTPEGAGITLDAQDRPVAPLTCTAVQFYKDLLKEGRPCVLGGRLWFDGKQLVVRSIRKSAEVSTVLIRVRATRPEARA